MNASQLKYEEPEAKNDVLNHVPQNPSLPKQSQAPCQKYRSAVLKGMDFEGFEEGGKKMPGGIANEQKHDDDGIRTHAPEDQCLMTTWIDLKLAD